AHQGWSRESVVGGRRIDKSIDVLDGRPGPADLAEQSDMAERVRRAVGVLPRGQREAIVLFYLAGRTEAETASALGVEIGSVKQRLHKGRGALRRNLASWDGGQRMATDEPSDLIELQVVDVRRGPAE